MAELVRMPKMSDTMTEGVLAKSHKNLGDTIKTGELVAEIETDKATMEFESFQEGVLLYKGVEEGKSAPVNGVLAILGKAGEDYKALLEEELSSKSAAPVVVAKEEIKAVAPVANETKVAPQAVPAIKSASPLSHATSAVNDDSRIKASPLAKKLAIDKGIDLAKIIGSGENGRVVKRDIDWFKQDSFVNAPTVMAGAVTTESFEEVPVSQMRKTIARRLAESKFTAPHFYLTMEINMDRCIDARESINAVSGTKLSFNDFVLKATASALRQHPKVNSSWLDDRIRYNHHIHIGVAVAVEDGLLVPVVRFTDSKTLTQINGEVKVYAQKAKDKKLQPSDWEGNTFTISNLGMFGIDEFTAIINPPDACILAVGGIKETVLFRNGQAIPTSIMKVTLSCDHRVVDGVTGAKFLQTLKGFLENPIVLLGQGAI
ncbi:MAG: pyruvate dehydrogenase complex dihydrolipoamide acetyltransferase [Bacteroidetes bacterium]|nr:pyruvate dehydrogenase complex dihydrolipoamide acetyltransferase [Bacteroidota bacterium]